MINPDYKYQIVGELPRLNNGAILYSCHFGIWEIMPKLLARQGYKMGIITNRYADYNKTCIAKLFDKLLFKIRSKNGVVVFYKGDIRKIIKFIKEKGIFCTLIDGDELYSKFQRIKRLALLTGACLIPFGIFLENGIATLKINCNLEDLIHSRPYDYWWFYKSRSKGI